MTGHMCQFGMMQEDGEGEGWVKKPTTFMTNALGIAKRLEKKCNDDHRHIMLVNGRAKKAEVHPDELCRQILIGLTEQMRIDGRIREGEMGSVSPTEEWEEYWVKHQVNSTSTLSGLNPDNMQNTPLIFLNT